MTYSDSTHRRKKCSSMMNTYLDSQLRRLFYKLGHFVGEHPGYFIIVPALVTALCATGFQRMDYNYDPEYLFSPKDGFGKQERGVVESYFPTNYSHFKASRLTRPGKLGRLVIAAKDGGSMLRTDLWDQLLYLDQVRYQTCLAKHMVNVLLPLQKMHDTVLVVLFCFVGRNW